MGSSDGYFFTTVNKTFNSLKAAELECGASWSSGSQARDFFSAPLFPVPTLMHSGRGQMNIIYKVTPLWSTPFTNQQTRAETTGSYGDLFDEFWKEKGKKKM